MQSKHFRIAGFLTALALTPAGLRAQAAQVGDSHDLQGISASPAAAGVPAVGDEAAVLGDAIAGSAELAGAEVDADRAVADPAAPLGEPTLVSDEEVRLMVRAMSGFSGSLRAAVLTGAARHRIDSDAMPVRWIEIFPEPVGVLGEPVRSQSTDAPRGAGIYLVERTGPDPTSVRPFPMAVITTVPFGMKRRGYLNGYYIGRYPTEGSGRRDEYAPPAGFIEVTPENQDFRVSEHFRLRQFLTKDQGSVWPKYVALDLTLIDKLELVLQELRAMGVRADAMHVMSGFRTPQYNGPGGDGRAALSRHTYGDAADVWVDSDGDGYMDDLNGDGRGDLDDARVMLIAVERVERRYPELVGGAGVYVATSAHGPFIHIDVRGTRARW